MNRRALAFTTPTLFAAAIALPAAAQPTVLFSDAFERTTGNSEPDPAVQFTDWGDNDNGLGGTETFTWITTPTRGTGGGVDQTVQEANDPADGDNEGVLRFGAVVADYNLATDPNVLAGNGYTIDFDFNRNIGGAGFLSFFLGYDPALVASESSGAAFKPINTAGFAEETDHAYILQNNPSVGNFRVQVFEAGAQQDPPGDINIFGPDPANELSASIRVDAPDGFDAGDDVTISLEVDGSPIADATNTFTLDGDFAGYFGFSSNIGGAYIDNLVVTALGTAVGGVTGDYDDSGQVEQGDLDIVLQNWGTGTFTGNESNLVGGGPFDGTVDQNELDGVLQNWGSVAAADFAGAAVPEPATLALLGVGGLAMLRRRD